MDCSLNRRQFITRTVAFTAVTTAAIHAADSPRQVSWLKEIQRPPSPAPPDPGWTSLLMDADGKPISTVEAWETRRGELRKEWSRLLGSLNLDSKATPQFRVLERVTEAGVVRERIEYETEPDVKVEAYLLRPEKGGQPGPGVAVFHSTVEHSILQPAGLGKDLEKAFGLKLAQRGCTCICPRNFLWPDNDHIAASEETKRFQQRHPQATGMAKMLHDAVIAVNILQNLPTVDRTRLGAVGHSLGAKEVLYLAAFDDRIRATVSSEGGIGLRFSNWDSPWYLGTQIKDPSFRHEHHELLACIAPRAFLLVGGESADGDKGWPFIQAALPVYRLYGDPPRIGQFNHRLGHAVPPIGEQRIYEWLETYL